MPFFQNVACLLWLKKISCACICTVWHCRHCIKLQPKQYNKNFLLSPSEWLFSRMYLCRLPTLPLVTARPGPWGPPRVWSLTDVVTGLEKMCNLQSRVCLENDNEAIEDGFGVMEIVFCVRVNCMWSHFPYF